MGADRDAGMEEVSPGLHRHTLIEACRKLAERASDGNSLGFMLAFATTKSPHTLGFNFYLHQHGFAASLHAVAKGAGNFEFQEPLFHRSGNPYDDRAQTVFFETSAAAMGVPYADLVRYVAECRSVWRFEGYVDGQPSGHTDNGRMWNPRLWNQITYEINEGHMPIYDLPIEVQSAIVRALRYHATEGVIVLSR